MGEIYKGLSIRIGVETSEMKKALRSSSAAINDTQKQLRQLAKAAKLDPNNIGLFNQQMDLMGDKARAVAVRLNSMREELSVMRNKIEAIRGEHVFEDLALSTKDAALNASRAKQEYADICDELRRFKNAISSAANEDEKIWKSIEEGSAAAKAKILELSGSLEKVAEYERLVDIYWEKLAKNDLATLVNDTKKLESGLMAAEAEAMAFYRDMTRLITLNPAATMTPEFKKLRNEMALMETAAGELVDEVRLLDKALDMDPDSIETARLKMAAMQEQVRLNVVRMEQLNDEIEQLKAAGAHETAGEFLDLRQEIAKTESKVSLLNKELDETNAKLEKLDDGDEFQRLSAHAEALTADLIEAEAHLDKLGAARSYNNARTSLAGLTAETNGMVAKMQDAGEKSLFLKGSMQQLGWSMYSTATPMFTMFGYTAVSAAEEVDAAYRDMRKTVQGNEEQFESMKKSALDYSRTHVTDAATLLEIEAMGGQLGIATDKLEGFATTISNLEIATNLDADTAAEQLGQLQGILNDMTQDDFDNFGDALVRLGNNNATLEDKIMDVMLRIGSMGTITGFSTTELLAWSTAVAATGQGAEAAGTAISNTLSDIETAVSGGGEGLAAFAEVAGMSAEEFKKAWNEAPSDAMKAWIEGLKRIEEGGGSADQTLQELGITGVRQKQSILGLMQTVGDLDDNLMMSQNAWDGISDEWGASGDAAREAERKAEGFSGAIQLLRNNVEALGTEMGESLTPAILAITDLIAFATQAYSDMGDLGKWAINAGILFAAGLGPAVVMIGGLVNAGKDFAKGISSMGGAWAKVVSENKLFNRVLGATVVEVDATADASKKAAAQVEKTGKSARVAGSGFKVFRGTLAALGIGLAVAGVLSLVEVLKDAYDRSVDMRKATRDLNRAVSGWSGIEATNGLNAYADFAHEAAMSVDELIEKQSELARSIEERMTATETDADLLEQWGDVILDLAGKSGISDEELAKLKIAVDEVNAACGTDYKVEQQGDAYVIMAEGAEVAKEAIYDLIEAKQAELRAEAYKETYKELYEQEAAAAKTLAQAEQDLTKARADYSEASTYLTGDALSSYADSVILAEKARDEAQLLYDSAADSVEAANELMTFNSMLAEGAGSEMMNWLEDEAVMLAILADADRGIFDFIESLEQLGVSQESLAGLSQEQLAAIATAYDGSYQSIAAILRSFGIDMNEMGNVFAGMVDWIVTKSSEMGPTVATAFEDMASRTGVSKEEFAKQLVDAGVSVQDFNELTADQLAGVLAAYDGNIEAIAAKIAELAEKNTEAGAAQATALSQSIMDNASYPIDATAQMVKDSNAELKGMVDSGHQYGYDYTAEVARGIEDGSSLVVDAVKNLIGTDGITQPARIAGQFAASSATNGGNSVNNTSTVNNYLSVGGIDLSNNQNAMEAAWALFQELEWRADT